MARGAKSQNIPLLINSMAYTYTAYIHTHARAHTHTDTHLSDARRAIRWRAAPDAKMLRRSSSDMARSASDRALVSKETYKETY